MQASPVFSSLPSGVYQVRGFDSCGNGTVVTHTLLSGATSMTIGSVSFPENELSACDKIVISNVLTAGSGDVLHYPLNSTYVLHFPDGTTQTVFKTLTNGPPSGQDAILEIPFIYDQSYYYDLSVTDSCGNTYILNNNSIDQKFVVSIAGTPAACGTYFLTIGASIYRPNLQIQFLDAPAGFVSTTFNALHPGPFSDQFTEYGSFTSPVPYGHYQIQISDGCGHTATAETTLIYQPAQPSNQAIPLPGCLSDRSKITIIIPGNLIASATVIVAPSAYGSTPNDVTSLINADGELVFLSLITGNYTVLLIDQCGVQYTYDFTVQGLNTSISYASRGGCELGKGSARIRGNDTQLTSVIVTAAPSTFTQALPFNASAYLSSSGDFSIGNLFPGSYTFEVTDNCGVSHAATIEVTGYEITSNTFTITPNCGSFNLNLSHTSTAVAESFWLQKFDPINTTWGNPADGTPYVDGTLPTSANSYLLQNNFNTINIAFTGDFRIIKSYQTFDDGSIGTFKICTEIIQTFLFNGEIQITGLEKVNCNGTYLDVKLYAIGTPPLQYSIIEKNHLPYFFDNGNSNVFTNLDPAAVYTFKVDQFCGDSKNYFDVAIDQLPSPVTANQANDMVACDDTSNNGKELFTLSDQDSTILGSQNPSLYTISYHLSFADASSNSNPLPTIYNSGTNEIFCRLKYNPSTDCYDITSFHLIVNPYLTNAPIDVTVCENFTTTITAPSGFSSYVWSTGETSQSITVSQSGQYILDVIKTYPNGTCGGQFTYNVSTSQAPKIDHLTIVDWTDTENSIEVILENTTGNFLYSLDNILFQNSPLFTNLLPGGYTVYVKDSYCGDDQSNAFLLNYPKFFTPNGDGNNDNWTIKFSNIEPNMTTFIYDQFGKLITSFKSGTACWDGTLNGQLLPSTDYWFVVTREDGRNLKGHFAMKR